MDRKKIWGWWFFDVASQPYFTLLLTFIFGPYFARIVATRFEAEGASTQLAGAHAQNAWSTMLTLTGIFIAVSAPVLGAMADAAGRKLPWVWVFSALYVGAAWGLWYAYPDASNYEWMLLTFAVGFIATEFATIFTNALLPELGPEEEVGAISGSGFALGYVGGVVALMLALVFLVDTGGRTLIGLPPLFGLDPAASQGTRAVGPFVAIWYVGFMIPFFLWVREAPAPRTTTRGALSELWSTIRGLKGRVSLTAFLGSSLFYRDALNGLYSFGGVYATLVLGWTVPQVGVFGIVGAISAALFSWVGGKADRARGPKPVITLSIVILIVVTFIILGMTQQSVWGVAVGPGLPDILMYVCGAAIGAAGGTLQASSRTLLVRHTDRAHATQIFGLYALSGKATAFLAPFLIGIATRVSESPRLGMFPLVPLFLVALILLAWVRPDGDRRT